MNTGQDNEEEFSSEDYPLYHGAPISYRVMMILLLTYTMRHKLTNEAISDLSLVWFVLNRIIAAVVYTNLSLFTVLSSEFFCYCLSCFGLLDSLATTICTACQRMFKSANEISYCAFSHFRAN